MTRGRALLRNYVATPQPVEPRSTKLPRMHTDRTMSAPARPDLYLMQDTGPQEQDSGPVALSTALLGASPIPQPLRRQRANTMVPSALDAHTLEDDWTADDEPLHEEWTLDDDTLEVETIRELPRVLGAVVELGVFFAGLAIGLVVQGALAVAVWTALS